MSAFFKLIPKSPVMSLPIVTCDIPNSKNIKNYITDFDKMGKDMYYQNISQNINKKKIELTVFNVPCGNNVEEDEVLDLISLCKLV